MEFSAHIFE